MGEGPGEGVTGVSRHNTIAYEQTNKKSRKIEFKIQKIKKIQK